MRVKFRLPWSDYILKLEKKGQTEDGAEILDPTPVAPPVGYVRQKSMVDIIREQIRSDALLARLNDRESFAESDDFDIPDDPIDPHTPYEDEFEPIADVVAEARDLEKKARAARAPQAPPEARQDTPSQGSSSSPQAPAAPAASTTPKPV